MGQIGGALDFGIRRIWPAEADVFARASREHDRILRHQRDARAHVNRIGRLDRHAVERNRAACGIGLVLSHNPKGLLTPVVTEDGDRGAETHV